jgi:hypothetical protein
MKRSRQASAAWSSFTKDGPTGTTCNICKKSVSRGKTSAACSSTPLWSHLSSFRDIESSELYALATILDPRYRTQCFLSADKADFAVEVLKERASEIEVNKTAASIVEESNPAGDEWALCMGTQADPIAAQPTSSADCEVTEYLKEKNIPRERCPFSWWAGNQQKFPLLSSLARRYLSAPMGSIASEREFKISKRIVEHRVNLKPDNVEMLLFMKYNLRMLDYNI